jgi:hypothetical protein
MYGREASSVSLLACGKKPFVLRETVRTESLVPTLYHRKTPHKPLQRDLFYSRGYLLCLRVNAFVPSQNRARFHDGAWLHNNFKA